MVMVMFMVVMAGGFMTIAAVTRGYVRGCGYGDTEGRGGCWW